jgi:hypothetical protein
LVYGNIKGFFFEQPCFAMDPTGSGSPSKNQLTIKRLDVRQQVDFEKRLPVHGVYQKVSVICSSLA